MSANDLQPLLNTGEECETLLNNLMAKGGKCSERIQALVSQISDLCRILQEHHEAAGSNTSAYANYPSCQVALQECCAFIKNYVEKSRTSRGSFLGSAKSFDEKKILSLEGKIRWQLDVGGRSAQADILRQTSVRTTKPLPDVLYNSMETMSASSSTRHSLSRMDGYCQSWGSGASTESSRLSYRRSSTCNSSSYAPSWKSVEEYRDMQEETSPQSRVSVASSMTSSNLQSICRIMSPEAYKKGLEKGFEKVFEKGISVDKMPSQPKQHEKWWEIFFTDKQGKPVLQHHISGPRSQTCIPYTEWGGWMRPLAVWIHDIDASGDTIRQKISILKASSGPKDFKGTPRYVFLDPHDTPDKFEAEYRKRLFFDFQSAIYGKTLLDVFDIDIITSTRRSEESSKQQLKIWMDYEGASTTNCYITFFANNYGDRRHLKFPLSWFDLGDIFTEEREVRLDFLTKSRIQSLGERQAKLQKAATFETQDTRTLSVFSVASSATFESMTTVSTSRSESRIYDSSIAKQDEISQKAEQMKYLKIKFTTLAASNIEYFRFQTRLVEIQYGFNASKATSPSFTGFDFPTRSPQASGVTQFEAMVSNSSSRKSSSSTGKGKSRSDSRNT